MSKLWIKAALIRALKTMAQTAAALIGVSAVLSEVDWPMVASASVLAGILSILTSIAGLPEVSIEAKKDVPPGYFETKPVLYADDGIYPSDEDETTGEDEDE